MDWDCHAPGAWSAGPGIPEATMILQAVSEQGRLPFASYPQHVSPNRVLRLLETAGAERAWRGHSRFMQIYATQVNY